ncbi:MAG: pyridoxamine 5'-phosphate oxidase family protein [Myxococcota bacterium]
MAALFHEGERRLQRSLGVEARIARMGQRMIGDHLDPGFQDFYSRISLLIGGVVDENGDAWATPLVGAPGFLSSPDAFTLQVAARLSASDPAMAGLRDGAPVGLQGISLEHRARTRLNGIVEMTGEDGFSVRVVQSYGNCPKYIQRRMPRMMTGGGGAAVEETTALTAAARSMIGAADTFFVASYAERADGAGRQVDVSHRGGKTGFVRFDADGGLTIPDYAGNMMFNTLGNFLVTPQAGLLFIDFENGDLLQLTGDAVVILDHPDIARFEGAERLWRFMPRRVVRRPDALPLRWDFLDWSPFSLKTGRWADVA